MLAGKRQDVITDVLNFCGAAVVFVYRVTAAGGKCNSQPLFSIFHSSAGCPQNCVRLCFLLSSNAHKRSDCGRVCPKMKQQMDTTHVNV